MSLFLSSYPDFNLAGIYLITTPLLYILVSTNHSHSVLNLIVLCKWLPLRLNKKDTIRIIGPLWGEPTRHPWIP